MGDIMQGIITDIKRFAIHDGDGIRTTFFLKGCPLKCVWCHNPEGILQKKQLAFLKHKCTNCGSCTDICDANICENKNHVFIRENCITCGKCEDICPNGAFRLYGKSITVDDALSIALEDKLFYETSGGGVTLSGGECLLQPDFCAELLKKLKEKNIHTAVDTCGFVAKEAIDKVLPYTDIFLYDLKAIDEDVHVQCTGQSNKIILENLKYLNQIGKSVEIRVPFVPNYNSNQIEKIKDFLKGISCVIKVKILPYHNFSASRYDALGMKNTLPDVIPKKEEILNAENIFIRNCEI
ncbi:MAG: glycyl-radical enzyme activating protein [Clostridia bacterium]|nr:glycyl-radical enzyme activating protein [Clostridia bacterium]